MAALIPFVQPILVGHHSEICDRSYRARIDSHHIKGVDACNSGKYNQTQASQKTETLADHLSKADPQAKSKS